MPYYLDECPKNQETGWQLTAGKKTSGSEHPARKKGGRSPFPSRGAPPPGRKRSPGPGGPSWRQELCFSSNANRRGGWQSRFWTVELEFQRPDRRLDLLLLICLSRLDRKRPLDRKKGD